MDKQFTSTGCDTPRQAIQRIGASDIDEDITYSYDVDEGPDNQGFARKMEDLLEPADGVSFIVVWCRWRWLF